MLNDKSERVGVARKKECNNVYRALKYIRYEKS